MSRWRKVGSILRSSAWSKGAQQTPKSIATSLTVWHRLSAPWHSAIKESLSVSRYLFTAFDLPESGKRVSRLRFYRLKKTLTPIVCGLCQESDVGDSQPSDLRPAA